MFKLTKLPEWKALIKHQKEIGKKHIRDFFQADPNRAKNFSITASDLFLDYSKNRMTPETKQLLISLANAVDLKTKIESLFKGDLVNNTEKRAALHTALRNLSNEPVFVDGQDIMPQIRNNLKNMGNLAEKIHAKKWLGYTGKPITDIVNIGIGGSDLGPALVTEALSPYAKDHLNIHFVSNVDAYQISKTLKKINPETTLFIVSSKSFGTLDTLTNAHTAKNWFLEKSRQSSLDKHFLAVTAQTEKAKEFGIIAENIYPVWDWVGGRYSIWSSIGLPVLLSIGIDNFREFLKGATEIDQHFKQTSFENNMPVMMGLLSVWYNNFFHTQAQAILPYDQSLYLLPAYLQQAHMESTGKNVQYDGSPVNYATGAIIFGTTGTNGQHAFYQLIHQGTHVIPVDFILPIQSHYPFQNHQNILFASCLSQSKALMEGKSAEQVRAELKAQKYSAKEIKALTPHKVLPGNRPSNTIIFSKLTPHSLGALLALYEHKIFTECAIWQINPFDQWSVELGKQIANEILPELTQTKSPAHQDQSTNQLIEKFRS